MAAASGGGKKGYGGRPSSSQTLNRVPWVSEGFKHRNYNFMQNQYALLCVTFPEAAYVQAQ